MSLKALIVREAFSVAVANNLRDARRQISLQQPDIVLLDLQLTGMNSASLIRLGAATD